jgi:hypothetical protein
MLWLDVAIRALSGLLIVVLVLVWWRAVVGFYNRSQYGTLNEDAGVNGDQPRPLPSPWKFIGIGAATFILSQIVHLPLNSFVLQPIASKFIDPGTNAPASTQSLWMVAIMFGT